MENKNNLTEKIDMLKNNIGTAKTALNQAEKNYDILLQFSEKADSKQSEFLEFCLEKMPITAYCENDFAEFLINIIKDAENFNDKQEFFDTVYDKWKKQSKTLNQKLVKPEDVFIQNSDVNNKFMECGIDRIIQKSEADDYLLPLNKLDNKTLIALDLEKTLEKGVISQKSLSPNARSVLNAVSSLQYSRNEIFALTDIFEIQTGKKAAHLTQKQKEEIYNGMNELSRYTGRFINDLILYNRDGDVISIPKKTDIRFFTYLPLKFQRSGKEVDAVQILNNVFFIYCLTTKGFLRIPLTSRIIYKLSGKPEYKQDTEGNKIYYLQTTSLSTRKLSSTTKTRSITEYIEKRLLLEYKGKRNTMLINTILENAGIAEDKAHRDRYIEIIMTYFENAKQNGIISKYRIYKYLKEIVKIEYEN